LLCNKETISEVKYWLSIDETFLTGKGMYNGTVQSTLVQPIDRLIIGMEITMEALSRIVRLNSDGSFDNSFR
jgi:hypothetical protein